MFNLQKESTQTELWNSSYDQTKFKYKSVWIQNLKISKNLFKLVLLDRGDQDEEVGVGFVGFGQTSKK